MSIVAVATSDGVTINEHFGQARQFHVFKVNDDGTYEKREEREILPFCGGDAAQHSHDGTVLQLEGVDAVLAVQIGPGAAESLQAKGIKAFGVKGTIDRTLTSYGKRGKILDQVLPGTGKGCSCGCGEGSGKGGCR